MEQFIKIITLPDNFPIILMGILTPFFTLLALYYGWKYDKIREDPEHKKSARKCPAKKLKRKAKLSASQRQNRVNQKIASFAAKQDA